MVMAMQSEACISTGTKLGENIPIYGEEFVRAFEDCDFKEFSGLGKFTYKPDDAPGLVHETFNSGMGAVILCSSIKFISSR